MDDIHVGMDNTFMIGKDDKVYGWGTYGSEDKYQFKPVHIKYLDNYNVIKLAGNQRSFALVTPKDNPNKKLVFYGKFAPFSSEDQIKTYDLFNGLDIYNIRPFSDKLLVSTTGNYNYRKKLSTQPFT